MALYNSSISDVTSLVTASSYPGNETLRSSAALKPIVHPNLAVVRFVCEVIVSFPIAISGIFGNAVAFSVLRKQKKRLTTTVVLQALAVADTLILISSILLRSMRYVGWQAYNDVYHYIFISLYPSVYFFRLADTWITVIMTIDRYIAVCYPLRAQRLCTLRRTYVIIGVIVLATFAFSTPRFFEFKLTDTGVSGSGYVHTTLITNRTYTLTYRIILFFIVMYLLPMSVLVVLNVRLLYALRHAYSTRDSMLSNGNPADSQTDNWNSSSSSSSSRSVTLIVVTVVVVCIGCNVITMTSHVLWALQMCFVELRYLEPKRRFLANVSNVMVTFNSAINFVIYCLFSKRFRSTIRQYVFCNRLLDMTRSWRSSCRSNTSGVGNTTNTMMPRSQERIPLKQTFSLTSRKSTEH